MMPRRFFNPNLAPTHCGALLALAAVAMIVATAQGADTPNPVESAIRASAKAFADAFNRGDAQALASQWTPGGTLVDDRGERFRGRPAIQAEYARFFKGNPGARIDVKVTTVDIASPTTAVEDGVSRLLTAAGAQVALGRYTAVHVLENGKWLISSVRESTLAGPTSAGQLAALAWLIGDWEVRVDGATVRRSFRWIAQNTFLQSDYSVRRDGAVVNSGTQIIGFDAQAGQIRSWSFDSTGGHGTGYWSPAPAGWIIDWRGVTGAGARTTSRDFLIQVPGQKNIVGWRSVDRTLGDAVLPDLKEVVLDRVATTPKK